MITIVTYVEDQTIGAGVITVREGDSAVRLLLPIAVDMYLYTCRIELNPIR